MGEVYEPKTFSPLVEIADSDNGVIFRVDKVLTPDFTPDLAAANCIDDAAVIHDVDDEQAAALSNFLRTGTFQEEHRAGVGGLMNSLDPAEKLFSAVCSSKVERLGRENIDKIESSLFGIDWKSTYVVNKAGRMALINEAGYPDVFVGDIDTVDEYESSLAEQHGLNRVVFDSEMVTSEDGTVQFLSKREHTTLGKYDETTGQFAEFVTILDRERFSQD